MWWPCDCRRCRLWLLQCWRWPLLLLWLLQCGRWPLLLLLLLLLLQRLHWL